MFCIKPLQNESTFRPHYWLKCTFVFRLNSRPTAGQIGEIDQNGGAYSEELAYLNWTVLLGYMFPDPVGVLM